jgi:hypothetical protein
MERTLGKERVRDVAAPDHLRARVRNAVQRTSSIRGRTRERLVVASILVPVLTVTVAMLASMLVYGHPLAGLSIAVDHGPMLVAVLAASIAVACGATFIAISRGANGLGPSAITLAIVTLVVAPLYAALILPMPLHTHEMASWPGISAWGARCFALAALVTVAALTLFASALRHAVPSAPRVRGAALGAAAGAWAGLAVFVFCPSGEQQHLLFGHVLPVLVATLGGIAVARFVRP